MLKSFGIVLNKLNIEQKDICIITQINEMVEKNADLCPILFFSEYAKTVAVPLFARMPIEEAYCFTNPVIVNDIESAELILECPCPTRKIFYLWDLEWIYDSNFSFEKYLRIYNSFEIIVRSGSHYNLFSKVWRKPDYLIEEFNHEQIRDLLIIK
jgi:hypothetical protein